MLTKRGIHKSTNTIKTKKMKITNRYTIGAIALAITSSSYAGDYAMPDKEPMTYEPESVISGSLSFDYNSHFISYGFDVWGLGGSTFNDGLFNPSLELAWALPGDTTFRIGTWWDVNDNAANSIGGRIQEIDIWAGFDFNLGPVATSVVYQSWIYGGTTEEILDIILAVDTVLAPSLTIHNRLDAGASGGNEGTYWVLGIDGFAFNDGVSFGGVDFSLPINIGVAGNNFHGAAAGSSGYGYSSIGLSATYPLEFISSAYGEWDVHAGATWYHTDATNIANPTEDFWTANFGIGCSF
tara:strand:+ start:1176 stop:2063 length:888 start_codon:yes stop_codon:yes gene_type:complete